MKVFLTGFMGSGKTTFGRLLAKELSYVFIDLDEEIEKKTGTSVPSIFNTRGEKTFRQIEREVLAEFFKLENAVIACGGGTPAYSDNIIEMNKNGITVFLKVGFEELVNRLSPNLNRRPLVQGKTGNDLKLFISDLLKKRNVFYRQSAIVINPEYITPKALVSFLEK